MNAGPQHMPNHQGKGNTLSFHYTWLHRAHRGICLEATAIECTGTSAPLYWDPSGATVQLVGKHHRPQVCIDVLPRIWYPESDVHIEDDRGHSFTKRSNKRVHQHATPDEDHTPVGDKPYDKSLIPYHAYSNTLPQVLTYTKIWLLDWRSWEHCKYGPSEIILVKFRFFKLNFCFLS